jgi:hypothetical protein
MLADVGRVYPVERVHEHAVHCWTQISHQAHEKERDLQHGMLDELYAIDDIVIPCHIFEICEQAEKLYENSNADCLSTSAG